MDAALFVGRAAELAAIIGALHRDLNVCVVGETGIGRTSLLRMAMHRLRQPGAEPAIRGTWESRYVRAEGARGGDDLLDLLVRGVTGRPAPSGTAEQLATLRRYRHEVAAAHRTPPADGRPVSGPVQVLVLIDDVTAGAGHDLFGRLRDELWSLGFRWLVAARSSERQLLNPPADAFFERIIALGPLTAGEAEQLIDRRQLWPRGWSAQVAAAGDGNPRRLLATARDLVDHRDSLAGALGERAHRDAALARLSRPATMLAAELDALGAASASDVELLSRLGWTRPRATQVFGELEAAGLVRSTRDTLTSTGRPTQGRPRRIFRLATPEEYATGT